MPTHSFFDGSRTLARRRGGREDSRELTTAFRRYVEGVLSHERPPRGHDADLALRLAEDIMGYRRNPAVDASIATQFSAPIRELATSVRRAGRSAPAHPALLARAIVLARTLERVGAGRRAGREQRSRRDARVVAR
jgi:hypothetical protein